MDAGEEKPLTSLSFLQSLYGNASVDMKIRIEAAKAALPYEHAREAAGEEAVRPLEVNIVRFGEPNT